MDRILTAVCTADDAALLIRNAWRYLSLGGQHVRVRSPDSDISIHPSGPVRYLATIEILDDADNPWGDADNDCINVVSRLFASELVDGT